MTTGAWLPGRTGCGPLTGHSPTIWWPMWIKQRSSWPSCCSPKEGSTPGRSLAAWPSAAACGQVTAASGSGSGSGWVGRNLSSVKWVLAFATSTGPMGLRPTSVWPPAHGRKLETPGWLNAIVRRFLVVTGVTFIPHSSSLPASGRGIVGSTGLPIKCWGEREVQLKLSGLCFKWTFLQAGVQMAILGIDFLRALSCLWIQLLASWSRMYTGLTLSTIFLSRGPTASAIASSADPGSLGQEATSAKEAIGTTLILMIFL